MPSSANLLELTNKPGSPLRNRLFYILLCFFLSGAAGLIYQVAWSKALGLVFGHTIYAVAVVLAVFMAGLAAGSAYFGSRWKEHPVPLALYARLEFLVGATGGLSLLGLAAVRWFYLWAYVAIESRQPLLMVLRVVGTSLVLFIPTFLMGGTLPVLVRGVTRQAEEFGVRLSLLYWINTTGAVTGTLVSGFLLLPVLGLRRTIALAVVLNFIAAVVALRTAKADTSPQTSWQPEEALPPAAEPQGVKARTLLVVFAAVGCTAFVYEIAWTRLLAITVGSSTYAFTLMLAVFLAGSVIGSAFFQRFAASSGRLSIVTLARSQMAIGIAALSSLVIFHWVPALIPPLLRATHQTFGGLLATQLIAAILTVFPAAALFGFNFPLVVLLFDRSSGGAGRSESVGRAYAANTMGAILGAIIAGFWLAPWLGTFRAIVVAAAVNLLLSLALNLSRRQRRILPLVVDVLCLAAALWVGGSSFLNNRSLLSLSAVLYGNTHQGRLTFEEIAATHDLVFAADGVNDSIAVLRTDDTVVLRVNGKADASTGDAPTQLLLGHLGAAFHPAPKRVLVVGFGSGMTVYALSLYPDVERIDCVEIEPLVVRAAPYLESLNHNVLRDPRVHVIFDDARNFLVTSREKYDLIVSEPSNPWIAGVATLFTDEYYAAARQRLAPEGIFVQWVQAYSLEPADLRMIMATFSPHFPEVTLWHGLTPDLLLLGRTSPTPLQFERLRNLWRIPALKKEFEFLHLRQPEGLMGYYLLDDPGVRKLAESSRVNTDDRTLLEYDAPRALLEINLSEVNQKVIQQFRAGPLPANLGGAEVSPSLEAGLQTALDVGDAANTRYFLAALESGPASAVQLVGQARIALSQNDLPKAKSFLQTALTMDPASADALHWFAVAERRSGDSVLAQAYVDQALSTHPDFLPALEDRLLLAGDRKDFRGAVTVQLDRMALMPDPPAYEYCRLGAIWMKVPNYSVAEPVLLKGLQKDPYSYACHVVLGELYRGTSRLDQARQSFEWVIRFFPDADSTVYRSLAGVYLKQGNTRSARSIIAKGRRIFPDNPEMQKAEEELN